MKKKFAKAERKNGTEQKKEQELNEKEYEDVIGYFAFKKPTKDKMHAFIAKTWENILFCCNPNLIKEKTYTKNSDEQFIKEVEKLAKFACFLKNQDNFEPLAFSLYVSEKYKEVAAATFKKRKKRTSNLWIEKIIQPQMTLLKTKELIQEQEQKEQGQPKKVDSHFVMSMLMDLHDMIRQKMLSSSFFCMPLTFAVGAIKSLKACHDILYGPSWVFTEQQSQKRKNEFVTASAKSMMKRCLADIVWGHYALQAPLKTSVTSLVSSVKTPPECAQPILKNATKEKKPSITPKPANSAKKAPKRIIPYYMVPRLEKVIDLVQTKKVALWLLMDNKKVTDQIELLGISARCNGVSMARMALRPAFFDRFPQRPADGQTFNKFQKHVYKQKIAVHLRDVERRRIKRSDAEMSSFLLDATRGPIDLHTSLRLCNLRLVSALMSVAAIKPFVHGWASGSTSPYHITKKKLFDFINEVPENSFVNLALRESYRKMFGGFCERSFYKNASQKKSPWGSNAFRFMPTLDLGATHLLPYEIYFYSSSSSSFVSSKAQPGSSKCWDLVQYIQSLIDSMPMIYDQTGQHFVEAERTKFAFARDMVMSCACALTEVLVQKKEKSEVYIKAYLHNLLEILIYLRDQLWSNFTDVGKKTSSRPPTAHSAIKHKNTPLVFQIVGTLGGLFSSVAEEIFSGPEVWRLDSSDSSRLLERSVCFLRTCDTLSTYLSSKDISMFEKRHQDMLGAWLDLSSSYHSLATKKNSEKPLDESFRFDRSKEAISWCLKNRLIPNTMVHLQDQFIKKQSIENILSSIKKEKSTTKKPLDKNNNTTTNNNQETLSKLGPSLGPESEWVTI